jgi:hypothetical protein
MVHSDAILAAVAANLAQIVGAEPLLGGYWSTRFGADEFRKRTWWLRNCDKTKRNTVTGARPHSLPGTSSDPYYYELKHGAIPSHPAS